MTTSNVTSAAPGSKVVPSRRNVEIRSIKSDSRIRKDLGDIDSLMHSIKTFGLIQPIVLAHDDLSNIVLIAGGRRLEAMRRIGRKELVWARDFIWKGEEDASERSHLMMRGMELEENIRRKSLKWSEEVLAKRQLFELMQSIYGVNKKGFGGGKHAQRDGFSLRRLAVMLGESSANTARDLQLADACLRHPMLSQLPSKYDAQRKLNVAFTVASMQATTRSVSQAASSSGYSPTPQARPTAAPAPSAPLAASAASAVRLYEGPFESSIGAIAPESVDLILTDLPYVEGQTGGLGTSQSPFEGSTASTAIGTFQKGVIIPKLLATLAKESYRILRHDRYAVIFYGATHHCLLLHSLEEAGFNVDPIPFIWFRRRTGAPYGGLSRYDPSYDQAFVARKGDPHFVRPNQANYFEYPSVSGAGRLHAGQKPVEVMMKFILDMLTPGCTVLDMFAGSGTTGAAARQLGMPSILFELDHANCEIIRARLNIK